MLTFLYDIACMTIGLKQVAKVMNSMVQQIKSRQCIHKNHKERSTVQKEIIKPQKKK